MDDLNPWGQRLPYTYEQGSAGMDARLMGGSTTGAGLGFMSGASSIFAPSQAGQGQQAQQPMPPATQSGGVPQTGLSWGMGDSDSAPDESEQFASALGQGVLAASQAGARQAAANEQRRKLGQRGQQSGPDQGLGATPGSEGY